MLIALLTLTLFFSSCAGRKQEDTVQLTLNTAALTTGIPQTGGIVVMGKARNNPQKFMFDGYATDQMTITLVKDHWDFYAFGWEGMTLLLQLIAPVERMKG